MKPIFLKQEIESINPQNNIIVKSINDKNVIDNLRKLCEYDLDNKGLEVIIVAKGKRKDIAFYDLYVRVRETYIMINSILQKLGYTLNKKRNLTLDKTDNPFDSIVLKLNDLAMQIFNKEIFKDWFIL